jgi:hypothetical protein
LWSIWSLHPGLCLPCDMLQGACGGSRACSGCTVGQAGGDMALGGGGDGDHGGTRRRITTQCNPKHRTLYLSHRFGPCLGWLGMASAGDGRVKVRGAPPPLPVGARPRSACLQPLPPSLRPRPHRPPRCQRSTARSTSNLPCQHVWGRRLCCMGTRAHHMGHARSRMGASARPDTPSPTRRGAWATRAQLPPSIPPLAGPSQPPSRYLYVRV